MKHIIYKITNQLNMKVYIGKHSSKIINDGYFGSGVALKRAINKYGKDKFKKEIICECKDETELNKMEIFHIENENSFHAGYNMTKGGEGTLGNKHSRESKLKSSISRRLYYINNPHARIVLSDKAKTKIGEMNPFYGKKLSKEHIEKMKIARVKAITGKNNPSARPVICVDTGIRYELAKYAAKEVGLSYSTTILKCCKGTRKKAGGMRWIYA